MRSPITFLGQLVARAPRTLLKQWFYPVIFMCFTDKTLKDVCIEYSDRAAMWLRMPETLLPLYLVDGLTMEVRKGCFASSRNAFLKAKI